MDFNRQPANLRVDRRAIKELNDRNSIRQLLKNKELEFILRTDLKKEYEAILKKLKASQTAKMNARKRGRGVKGGRASRTKERRDNFIAQRGERRSGGEEEVRVMGESEEAQKKKLQETFLLINQLRQVDQQQRDNPQQLIEQQNQFIAQQMTAQNQFLMALAGLPGQRPGVQAPPNAPLENQPRPVEQQLLEIEIGALSEEDTDEEPEVSQDFPERPAEVPVFIPGEPGEPEPEEPSPAPEFVPGGEFQVDIPPPPAQLSPIEESPSQPVAGGFEEEFEEQLQEALQSPPKPPTEIEQIQQETSAGLEEQKRLAEALAEAEKLKEQKRQKEELERQQAEEEQEEEEEGGLPLVLSDLTETMERARAAELERQTQEAFEEYSAVPYESVEEQLLSGGFASPQEREEFLGGLTPQRDEIPVGAQTPIRGLEGDVKQFAGAQAQTPARPEPPADQPEIPFTETPPEIPPLSQGALVQPPAPEPAPELSTPFRALEEELFVAPPPPPPELPTEPVPPPSPRDPQLDIFLLRSKTKADYKRELEVYNRFRKSEDLSEVDVAEEIKGFKIKKDKVSGLSDLPTPAPEPAPEPAPKKKAKVLSIKKGDKVKYTDPKGGGTATAEVVGVDAVDIAEGVQPSMTIKVGSGAERNVPVESVEVISKQREMDISAELSKKYPELITKKLLTKVKGGLRMKIGKSDAEKIRAIIGDDGELYDELITIRTERKEREQEEKARKKKEKEEKDLVET